MFNLHPQLAADTVAIATWELSHLRLMMDANFPWLILIPARDGVTGIHQLTDEDAATLMAEVSHASRVLEKLYTPTRINVGALGNIVPQLHVHVVARFETDAAWPGPVWGAVPRKGYQDDDLRRTVSAIQQEIAA